MLVSVPTVLVVLALAVRTTRVSVPTVHVLLVLAVRTTLVSVPTVLVVSVPTVLVSPTSGGIVLVVLMSVVSSGIVLAGTRGPAVVRAVILVVARVVVVVAFVAVVVAVKRWCSCRQSMVTFAIAVAFLPRVSVSVHTRLASVLVVLVANLA